MLIAPTGQNKQKSKFFDEIANSFTFLSIYYGLSAEQQQYLLEVINKLHAEQLMENDNDKN